MMWWWFTQKMAMMKKLKRNAKLRCEVNHPCAECGEGMIFQFRDVQFENENGEDDGKHAIAKGFEAGFGHCVSFRHCEEGALPDDTCVARQCGEQSLDCARLLRAENHRSRNDVAWDEKMFEKTESG